ncbi:S1 family peptidase [Actinomyces gaoshouyii]|uniref:Peptidase S1 domain-containing protein n=1 Tax=Actinomyces gaoshouyii TaxID=1960083 RepID=A0A8H9LHV9_9ACTO|nr:trypsin-like serine protease [Actinomyces gaoshouyii]ARD41077.1 hypothetical protein B6G06_00665 [Actinomyces gaoshouyii]GGO94656.1 hypothetical protein GCM10011612_00590 [Actinomyces gaoshouyii]
MKILRPIRAVVATSAIALTILLPATAAQALESSTFAEENDESNAVVSEELGTGSEAGGCTGAAIAPHWVLTARHCVDTYPNPAGSVRLGQGSNQRTVAIDRWEVAPAGDFALLHTVEDMGLSSYPTLASKTPDSGEGTMYGWSEDGSGGQTRLPTARGKIEGFSEISLYEGAPSIQVTAQDGAKTQAGDSGAPLFVNGELVGVLSASLDTEGDDTRSSNAAYAQVAEQREWIMGVVDGSNKGSGGARSDDAVSGSDGLSPLWIGGGAVALVAAGAGTYFVMRRRPDAQESEGGDRGEQ